MTRAPAGGAERTSVGGRARGGGGFGALASRWRVPLGFLLAAVFLWRARPTPLSLAVGLPLAALGLALRAAAAGHIRKNDALATSGPYRFTRNPLYLGSAILAAGFVVAAADWVLLALTLLMLFGIYHPVIRREEAYLADRFGAEFADFCGRVPRLWPRLTPAPNPRTAAAADPAAHHPGAVAVFSWALYRRHREYNALLGYWGLAALVLLKWLWLAGRWPF